MRMRWTLLLIPLLMACTVRTGRPVYVVKESPPAQRTEVRDHRPGLVWVEGRWEYVDNQWVWHKGTFTRGHEDQQWVQGRWVKHGDHWQYHPGHWKRLRG